MVQSMIDVAMEFLFPNLSSSSSDYLEISSFIWNEYSRIGTSVLYFRNKEFMKLLENCSLSIGNKEVIVVGNSVRASHHYTIEPQIIFEA